MAPDGEFVRTYTLTGGRTQPRHLLAMETVLEAGPRPAGPGQSQECGQIVALCREHRRSVAELAGLLRRPVTAVKVLVSDLLDADALTLPLPAPYASGPDGKPRPDLQLLVALSTGLRKKFPDAQSMLRAG
ncbi:DUF742 domain-containing protein [Streptomyces sp. SID8366]|nr:DUF742 domain-containing protein [Streptomyces sp. SID8366]MYU67456.1 DUF742 domain-containing protein [Streptomyces sp. SID69]